jgi:hypothetical protein
MARERGLYRRKDSRFWWIGLVLPDGRRVCSTGCINRTDAESYAVRLKNEAIEARQQGLLGIFVWQQAVVRYLEEFADKRSLSDDKDHLRKLDPYLRSLKRHSLECGRRGGARIDPGTAPALVLHLCRSAHPAKFDRVGQGETARRHRGLPLPRPEAHLGLLARAERHFAAGADGIGRLEVVRDGAALCAPGPGETEFRGRTH